MARSRAAGLALGFLADRLLGDPARWHPVAGFGQAAARLEQHLWADDRAAGIRYTTALVGGAGVAGWWVERRVRHRPVLHTLVTATATWVVLGGRSLEIEAAAVADRLEAGDLPGARVQVARLVGRDTTALDASGVCRAAVESVAENTSDAVVAPLAIGSITGLGGLLAYRAANTLDAMVGHRSTRYANFGWAAARLDDLLNLPGSRLAAALAALWAPAVGGRPSEAWRVWRRDATDHPSPNAGPVEAAFAGALSVRLGGRNVYGERIEDRAALGDGRSPEAADIRRATRLALLVDIGALGVAAAVATFGIRSSRRT